MRITAKAKNKIEKQNLTPKNLDLVSLLCPLSCGLSHQPLMIYYYRDPDGDTVLPLCKGHTVSRDFIWVRSCPHIPGGNPLMKLINNQPEQVSGQHCSGGERLAQW